MVSTAEVLYDIMYAAWQTLIIRGMQTQVARYGYRGVLIKYHSIGGKRWEVYCRRKT